MGMLWRQRRQRLSELLSIPDSSSSEQDPISNALDELPSAASKAEVQRLKFGLSDLLVVSALEKGQFGVVEVVQCRLNNTVYARKKIQKSTAQKFRDHCFVQSERDILLKATLTNTPWAPHLLCAFQTDDSLHLVMDYAEGGNLWEILESAMDNRLAEDDLRWWVPQAVSAIGWCHSQGFAHRDIKPHNFVLTRHARLQLIDFGCAAPLLSATQHPHGRRAIPKPYCLVPCGTCDYISPEILQAHEDALFAVEMDQDGSISMSEEGYGCETDWWSLGAVVYELAVGVAPFFAPDIKQTYSLIVDHERTMINFDLSLNLSNSFKNLIRCFLSSADERLGRSGELQIQQHPWFASTKWQTLHLQHPPPSLMLPPRSGPNIDAIVDDMSMEEERSNPFDFSHLFKSTPGSSRFHDSVSGHRPNLPSMWQQFPGFSWGPQLHAFDSVAMTNAEKATPLQDVQNTPRPVKQTPAAASRAVNRPLFDTRFSDPGANVNRFSTPIRPPFFPHAQSTIPRPVGFPTSVRPTRIVSEREALRQMINCVSASARKKVLESGRKPRFISTLRGPSSSSTLSVHSRHRPKIPSLQLAQHDPTGTLTEINILPPRKELNASESMDESAPPSPSPRPGSSLSRRSGSQSPYPFSRSTAPSPMLEPGSATGTLTSITSMRQLSNGGRQPKSRTGSYTGPLPTPRASIPASMYTPPVTVMKVVGNPLAPAPAPPRPPPTSTVIVSQPKPPTRVKKQKATSVLPASNSVVSDPFDLVETQLDSLLGDLGRIEDNIRKLKSLVAPL